MQEVRMEEQLAILLIKIGLFFANCDGVYDPREKKFITNFIMSLELNGLIDTGSLKEDVVKDIKYDDINGIIDETNKFIGQLEEDEREPFGSMLNNYIEGIIKADGVIDPNETHYYNMWKEEVKS